MKKRYKNVFAESVERYEPVEIMAAMAKDDAKRALLSKALKQNFVFEALDEGELRACVNVMSLEKIAEGTKIIEQGNMGDFFYVVESGAFDFIVDGEKKGSCMVAAAAPYPSFGELALLYGAPRAATVKATAASVVWALDRKTFRSTVASGSTKQRAKVSEALSHVDLLSGLTDEQLEEIVDAVQVAKFPKGHLIIEKGTTGNVFYMIQEGDVECTDVGESNQFKNLVLPRGEYFGERALLMDQLRAANVTAKTDVTLLALDREAFQRVLGPLRRVLDDNLNMRVLGSVDLLSTLSHSERQRAISLFQERKYAPGERIIQQGEQGSEFFIIKSGTANVVVKGGAGGSSATETRVAQLKAGSYFGEQALLKKDTRNASVVADPEAPDAVNCFVLAREDFDTHLGSLTSIIEKAAAARSKQTADLVKREALSSIAFNELVVIASLGAGTFGRVKLVSYNKSAGAYFALKTMHKSEVVAHRQVANVIREKELMILLEHPFILKLYAAYQDDHRLHLLLEFVQGGELFSVLHTSSYDGVPEPTAKFYASGVAMAIEAMHERHVAYRDLKPENIMIDAKGYPKVVDFGFAKIVTRKTFTLCGTPEYLAPEIVLGRGHTKSVDWWAFGILVYEMIAGYSPFADAVNMDHVQIFKNIHSAKLVFPRKFPADAAEFVKRFVYRNPSERLCTLKGGAYKDQRWVRDIDWDRMLDLTLAPPWKPKISSATDTSNFEPYEGNDAIDRKYKDDTTLWVNFSTKGK